MTIEVIVPCFLVPRMDERLRHMRRILFQIKYKAHPPRLRRPPRRPSPSRIHESHGRATCATSYSLRDSSSSPRAVLVTFFLADQCTSLWSSCHPCRSLQAPPSSLCDVGVRWVSSVAPICWLQCRCGLSTQNIGCFRQRALSLIFRGFGPFDGHVSAGEVARRVHCGNTQHSW